jgi:FtsZ-interacting cell division protein ZipA
MVLNGAGGWENRKTLATNAKMMREERRREGKRRKGERRWVKNPSLVDGTTRKTTSPPKKTPNDRHIRQDTEPQPQTNQPKSRRPILATSKKLIIQYRCALERKPIYSILETPKPQGKNNAESTKSMTKT